MNSVMERISNLDEGSSIGPDNIHPRLLKQCPNTVVPLFLIMQKSLRLGKIPLVWKHSEIIPIFKSSSRYDPLNYRPISLTSVPCKILERIISDKIVKFMKHGNILSNDQFGFRD